jgi:hypothetical protein
MFGYAGTASAVMRGNMLGPATAVVFASAWVCGCSTQQFSPEASNRMLIDYETIIAQAAPRTILRSQGKEIDIAKARPTILSEPGDWVVCLRVKGKDKEKVVYYAVFLAEAKVEDWRPAVAIDHCERQGYHPLPK